MAVFARVVETSSFSATARAFATTTSAVSKRVARLEERLGVRLLERSTRRVAPTDAGATFYTHAARIVREVDDAESAVTRFGMAPRGTLRISAPVILGERFVAPLIASLLADYPELRIELSLTDRFVNLLEEHVDVAVRVGALADSSLVGVRVGAAAGIVCASPAYLARRGMPSKPRDLALHNCLRYALVSASREWRFRGPEGEFSVPVTGNLEVNHGGAMREAALAGVGIAKLPDFLVADAIASGALVAALDAWRGAELPIHLVYMSGVQPMPKVRAFVDALGPALKRRLARLAV